MNRNIKARRVIALFLLCNFLQYTFWPTLSMALTSGPTAPEATSFEPVDTTDMVNLNTGDFVYNIPLLEVPGPGGGYPLSLSYHAGIQPNEDASWVGLGWTLNPGAINRTVNGYADDHENVDQVNRVYWEGGRTSTRSIGITIGQGESPASVTFGLSYSDDTYQGSSITPFAGIGVSTNFGDSFGANIGIDTRGGGTLAASIGTGYNLGEGQTGLSVGAKLGVSTNFESIDANAGAGVSYKYESGEDDVSSFSLLGASIGTNNTKPSLSIAGFSSGVHNSKAGRVRSRFKSSSFTIPTPYFSISLGKSYHRYWSDEKVDIATHGTLHYPDGFVGPDYFDDKAFDTYTLLDPEQNILDHADPEKVLGGSFPSYDQYTVTGQGVGGQIRPYHFQKNLYRQNEKDKKNVYNVKQYSYIDNADTRKAQFRYVNDFANSIEFTSGDFTVRSSGGPTADYNFGDLVSPEEGFQNNHLAGSKHVEKYTNSEILEGMAMTKGFIDNQALGFERESNSQIGGFVVTNETGVNYHYALPVYSFDEFFKSEKIDQSGGETFNSLNKPQKYAYTWYLTAITGPDYVDRNSDGLVNQGDWGYWVGMDYGLWADNYTWRNPYEGFRQDLDREWQNFSKGRKELYYLNTMRTATHTAVFVKDARPDGRGATGSLPGQFDEEAQVQLFCQDYNLGTMRLESIYLFQNEDYQNVVDESLSDEASVLDLKSSCWVQLNRQRPYPPGPGVENVLVGVRPHFGEYVIDKYDLDEPTDGSPLRGQLDVIALRKIDLLTDYSLTPGTNNSFNLDTSYQKEGKLTLNGLQFLGKGAKGAIPPLRFGYDLEEENNAHTVSIQNVVNGPTYLQDINGTLEAGDLLRFDYEGRTYYGVLLSLPNAGYELRSIGQPLPEMGVPAVLVAYKTKNPPYEKDHHDIWNMYKSDYVAQETSNGDLITNSDVNRFTTKVSSKNVDVWSLRQIETSLGAQINIDYESDSYHKSVLHRNNSLIIESFTERQGDEIGLNINTGGLDLKDIFEVGDQIDVIALVKQVLRVGFQSPTRRILYQGLDSKNLNIKKPEVVLVDENYLEIRSKGLVDTLHYRTDNGTLTYSPLGGNISFTNTLENYGGGVRVSSITTAEPQTNISYKTKYNYFQPSSDVSSGVTSYEPVGLDKHGEYIVESDTLTQEQLKLFKGVLYKSFSNLLANAREIPAPGVLYEYVTISESVHHSGETLDRSLPEQNRYQFQVFDEGMTGYEYAPVDTTDMIRVYSGLLFNEVLTREVTLKDFSTQVGNLKKVAILDKNGNKLSETINHYLHDDVERERANDPDISNRFQALVNNYEPLISDEFNNQGVVMEGFKDGRVVRNFNGTVSNRSDDYYQLLAIASRRETYPAIPTGVTQIDHRTGITTTTKNLAFDFYSGVPTKTLTEDSHGNKYITISEPAYQVTKSDGSKAYPGMGLKVSNVNNKNMLTQEGTSYVYKVNEQYENNPSAGNILGVVSAGAQTWSDQINVEGGSFQPNIWRKHRSFSWVGGEDLQEDGTYAYNTLATDPFEAWGHYTNPSSNSSWQQQSEITRVDYYSHALEAKDLNGDFAATKMDSKQEKVLATAANARYAEFAYSGAEDELVNRSSEDYFGGGVAKEAGVLSSAKSHTGKYSLQTTGNERAFHYRIGSPVGGRTYRISAWSSSPSGNIQYQLGTGPVQTVQANASKVADGWYLINANVTARNNQDMEAWCNGTGSGTKYYDDFRIHPVDAPMTSYVYNEWNELSYILDANNLFSRFEYDPTGRLVATYREALEYGERLVSDISYNYGKTGQALSLDRESISFGTNGGSQRIEVTADEGWTVTDDQSWIITFPSAGNGNGFLNLITPRYSGASPRTGTLTVTSQGITRTIAVTQEPGAVAPQLVVGRSLVEPTGQGGTETVAVTSNIAWSTSDNEPWITVLPPDGAGNGNISIITEPNTALDSRTGIVRVSGGDIVRTITVNQAPGNTLTVSPSTVNFGNQSESREVIITSNTSWNVVSSPSWINVSPDSGTDNGTISLTTTANGSVTPRSGAIIMNSNSGPERTITVTQAGADPILQANPDALNVTASASTEVLNITSNITWSATTTSPDWISVGSGGTNDGTLEVFVGQNIYTTSRSGTITISGGGITRVVNVTQQGAEVALHVDATALTLPAAGGSADVSVSSNTTWTLSANQTWINVPKSGFGNDTFTITAESNSSNGSRTGIVTVTAGNETRTVDITQSAPELTLDISALSFGKEGGSKSVTVNSNMSWTVSHDQPWITLSPTEGSGDAGLTITTSANTSFSPRSGTVTVSAGGLNRTVNITQEKSIQLEIEPASITFSASEEAQEVSVTSNDRWDITASPNWITPSPSFGRDNGTFTLTAEANVDVASRSGTVSLEADDVTRSISVTQNGATPYINVPNNVAFGATSQSRTIDVNTNVPSWTTSVTQGSSWITITPYVVPDAPRFNINVSANSGNEDRTGTVVVSGAGVNKTITVNQSGQPQLDVSTNSVSGGSGLFTADIDVTSNVSWTVSENVGWLYVTNGFGSNNGTFTINVSQVNQSTAPRSATFIINGSFGLTQEITVTQNGAAALLQVSPSTLSVPPGGGTETINVTSNIPWTATTNSPSWISIPAGGTNGGSMEVVISSNPSANGRTGTITLSGGGINRTVSVAQQGSAAVINVNTSSVTIPPTGGSTNITISSNADWSVSDNQSWISYTPGSGSGNGLITITASSNTGTTSRNGSVTVSGGGVSKTITVSQSAPQLSVNPTTLSYFPGGGNQNVTVTSNIPWAVSDNQSWISVSPSSGSGNGSFTISATVNTSFSPRSGTVTITGGGLTRTIPITQNRAGQLEVSPTSVTLDHFDGSTKTVSITSNGSWTGTSNRAWVYAWPSGSNNGTLRIEALADNLSITARTATITVSSNTEGTVTTRTIQVTQSPAPLNLEVSPSSISLDADGNFKLVDITSNVNWTVTTNRSWINVDQSSGSNVTALVVTADQNTGSSRSGTITISGGGISRTVSVNQAASPPILSATPRRIAVAWQGGSHQITVASNTSWTVSDNASWISVSPVNGNNNGTVTITVSPHSASCDPDRSGTVTIDGGAAGRSTITIDQESKRTGKGCL